MPFGMFCTFLYQVSCCHFSYIHVCVSVCVDNNPELVYAKFMTAYHCYDLIPTSSKLVVFDTQLNVRLSHCWSCALQLCDMHHYKCCDPIL